MNTDSILTDLRYAIEQLRRAEGRGPMRQDCIERARDALDRVEAELAAPPASPFSSVPQCVPIGVAECPGCGRRCQAGHVCDLCSAG